jgi:hypothetical protein
MTSFSSPSGSGRHIPQGQVLQAGAHLPACRAELRCREANVEG